MLARSSAERFLSTAREDCFLFFIKLKKTFMLVIIPF